MHIVHLTASTFFGGPERQMLGLGEHLPRHWRSTYISFPEGGRCRDFLSQAQGRGFAAYALQNDTPRFRVTLREVTQSLLQRRADILVTHTFKPNVLGRIAARRLGIPAVAVSRGWTWENLKVRMYEAIDRCNLRYMDHVIAVSAGQAERVRRAGVPGPRLSVIRNASRLQAFDHPDPAFRRKLLGLFAPSCGVDRVILAAGRLSPEKGFSLLVEAAVPILQQFPNTGIVLFGEGAERPALEEALRARGLSARFVMPGFTSELDRYLPFAEAVVLPSYTEGLPNVALEASAAGVPVVATAVGGTPEVVVDGETGYLVPGGQPGLITDRLMRLLQDRALSRRLGQAGRTRMEREFTFAAQAERYAELFERLLAKPVARGRQ